MHVLDGRRPGASNRPLMRAIRSSISSRCARYSGLSRRDGTRTWIIVVVSARSGSCSRNRSNACELLRDALRVVEPLDAEDEPPALVLLLEVGEEPLGLRVREHLPEALDVDADRIDADPDPPAVELEPVRLRVDPEHAEARGAEVAGVVADLEAHVVGPEHSAQQLLPLGQQAVDLGRRERDVEEEADREPRRARAQHRRHEHEVEVVHPDTRVGLAVLEDRLCEALVHLDVASPRLGRDAQPLGEVVEERPERVVADLPVEVRLLLGRQEDRIQVVLRQARPHAACRRRGTTLPGQPTHVASPRTPRTEPPTVRPRCAPPEPACRP